MPEAAIRALPQVTTAPWLAALPPAMRFILHGGQSVRSTAAPIWGFDFAEESCRASTRDSRAALWLGPDEYLLLGFDESAKDSAAAALENALADIPHALVDVSHRQFGLEVRGPHCEDILNGACPLDLSAVEFPVGMCTRTVLAKADIVLWRTREDAFHLEVWRSFNGYVTGLLREIAREFYPE
jgi:sarcosine oxidase subunit gamma